MTYNSERDKAYFLEYYHKNKEHLNESRRLKKASCPCGGTIYGSNPNGHLRTKKHKLFLEQIKKVDIYASSSNTDVDYKQSRSTET